MLTCNHLLGVTLQIVPDDTYERVDELLENIFLLQKCKHLPEFFSTDNVAKDQYTVADKFKAIRAARAELGLSSQPVTQVLQDIWHARERVSRELKRSHPDYFQAVAQLNQIFGR